MIADAKLARPGLAVDLAHDNRHRLPDSPIARESMPMMINLPELGIAGFTYTWVNGASEAGAMLALFGPGIGEEPIQVRLPDRRVPPEMDFGDWNIDGFTVRHDLKFGSCDVLWDSPEAKFDLKFEAFHPPYAYGANKDGCPSYTATDRIEQSGTLKGTITVGGKTHVVDGLGHRDHSWGTRDWGAFQHYNWFEGQTADGVAVHFWRFIALGQIHLRGYVFKDDLLAEVTDVDFQMTYSDDLWQQKMVATISDEAGRETEVIADFYTHYTLIPSDVLHLREGAARTTYDGRPGIGWMECAWAPSYLAYVAANGPY
ncbi:MAG: hypothetical protein JWR80_3031 [Bradyrhizobium sp.]|nr:hypothetical protein [Bradyrhizobium sp.]